jgi:ribokinase
VPIITLGRHGLVFMPSGATAPEWVPADRVEAVDTTGAGDSFCGAFGFFLSHFDLSDSALPPEIRNRHQGSIALREVLRRSVYVATQSITRAGSQTSPRRDELPESIFAPSSST